MSVRMSTEVVLFYQNFATCMPLLGLKNVEIGLKIGKNQQKANF